MIKDLTGQRFNRLTAQWPAGALKGGRVVWLCLCDCGALKIATSGNLHQGNIKSCGCLRRELSTRRIRKAGIIGQPRAAKAAAIIHTTHGQAGAGKQTPEYRTWAGMIRRCENPKQLNYPRYGGRGIAVCERWRDSFEDFFADMGPKPSPEHSIDRINNLWGYEPANCRWATDAEQRANKRKK